ncbi:MAG: NusG domain II-containing protein [Eubacteriales bacterium]|nr:NusG domain II-containing protein [Eubacteriales bacterium]
MAAVITAIAITGIIINHAVSEGAVSSGSLVAIVKQDDRIIYRIALDEVEGQRRIPVSGACEQSVLAEKGRIRFESSSCPDKICVGAGWLSMPGQMAVCIPNRTLIKIVQSGDTGTESTENRDVDIKAY